MRRSTAATSAVAHVVEQAAGQDQLEGAALVEVDGGPMPRLRGRTAPASRPGQLAPAEGEGRRVAVDRSRPPRRVGHGVQGARNLGRAAAPRTSTRAARRSTRACRPAGAALPAWAPRPAVLAGPPPGQRGDLDGAGERARGRARRRRQPGLAGLVSSDWPRGRRLQAAHERRQPVDGGPGRAARAAPAGAGGRPRGRARRQPAERRAHQAKGVLLARRPVIEEEERVLVTSSSSRRTSSRTAVSYNRALPPSGHSRGHAYAFTWFRPAGPPGFAWAKTLWSSAEPQGLDFLPRHADEVARFSWRMVTRTSSRTCPSMAHALDVAAGRGRSDRGGRGRSRPASPGRARR